MSMRRGHLLRATTVSVALAVSVVLFFARCAAQDEASCPAGEASCTGASESERRPRLSMPPVIIGCWQLLERDRQESHAVEALLKYAEAGFTAFDTADIYGPSERILGDFRRKWVAEHPDAPPLRFFTKYVTDDTTWPHAERINKESRRSLGVESLDMVQFHFWSLDQRGRSTAHVKPAQHLARLQEDGRIRHVAACNFDTKNLDIMVQAGIPIEANQVQYSLLDRRPEVRLLPYCRKHDIQLTVFGVVAGGLLSDAFLGVSEAALETELNSVSRRMYYTSLRSWSQGRWELYQELLQTMRHVADRHGSRTTIATIASMWALQRMKDLGAGGSIILGIRDARHLTEHSDLLLGAAGELTSTDMKEIQAVLDKGRPPSGDIWDRERGWSN